MNSQNRRGPATSRVGGDVARRAGRRRPSMTDPPRGASHLTPSALGIHRKEPVALDRPVRLNRHPHGGGHMFEVWEITSGNGVGELLVAAVGDYADMPPKLRDRLRKVGIGAF